ncbi:U3 small nucleolar RNA-associated protein 18 homolog [Penaeus chinensis]|uniref:U3 small nucleolar RNA-associated protein 18 homolog n=1 Tax=Penaeus chinensis TaxID=139456 RepID=UPI001FB6089A|nr:U3 small nucleolar RNA-associated protein 18 homolog [Penaeus chinensis]XP_047489761.1 U3 small nucleolar RNA-associated protein 18 homolog [Penaeus chinensis]XP_047489762.1 U3 small nucleolar RNA-associated protein 18 homolog [Penaeus chinensis]
MKNKSGQSKTGSKSGQTDMKNEIGQSNMSKERHQGRTKKNIKKRPNTMVHTKNFPEQNRKAPMKMAKKRPAFSIDTVGNRGKKKKPDAWGKVNYEATNTFVSHKEIRRERELVEDLFGDVDLPEVDTEVNEEEPRSIEQPKVDKKEKDSGLIPDDPYDLHLDDRKTAQKKPVWVDEDDDNIRVKDVMANMSKMRGKRGAREVSDERYENMLKEKFELAMGSTPEWAQLDRKIENDSDDEGDFNRRTGNYISSEGPSRLPKTVLEYKMLSDLNRATYAEGAIIKGVEFNPVFQVALVAGFSKTNGSATLFQVDGLHNHKIQNMKFPRFPIKCAKFFKDGRRFVVGSDLYGHFFVYDMEGGKEIKIPWNKSEDRRCMKKFVISPDGELLLFFGSKSLIHIFDTKTLSHIDTLQASEEVTSATFNSSGTRMYTHGNGGDVLIWDINSRVCVQKFYDDGCIDGMSIALSPNNQYLACGSSSGIVNIYDTADLTKDTPLPVKVLDKLVTSVTSLTFNASSELLAMGSDFKDNAFKLVHFPSMTYFTNFPREGTNLARVQVAQFSPNGGYMAAGNNGGTVRLYRLKHYRSY